VVASLGDEPGPELITQERFAAWARDMRMQGDYDLTALPTSNEPFVVQFGSWGAALNDAGGLVLRLAAGRRPVKMHCDYSTDAMRADLPKVIADHQAMGCHYAGIGGAPKDARENAATWSAFAKEASEIGAKLKEHGITFIYHNHSQEFAKMDDGRRVMDILFEDSDPTTFQFEPDLYWVAHGGGSPVAWLKKLAGRCDVIHLKDFAIKADRTQYYTEIGEGNLDWPTIMATVEQIGVKWMPVEQDTCPGNPFDSLALSYQNLSSWGYR